MKLRQSLHNVASYQFATIGLISLDNSIKKKEEIDDIRCENKYLEFSLNSLIFVSIPKNCPLFLKRNRESIETIQNLPKRERKQTSFTIVSPRWNERRSLVSRRSLSNFLKRKAFLLPTQPLNVKGAKEHQVKEREPSLRFFSPPNCIGCLNQRVSY